MATRLRMLSPMVGAQPTHGRLGQLVPQTRTWGQGSAASRGYDHAWRKLRLEVLADEPLCRFCAVDGRVTAATEVDHIETIAEAPHLRLVRSNLRPLCSPCHVARTHRHTAMRRRGF